MLGFPWVGDGHKADDARESEHALLVADMAECDEVFFGRDFDGRDSTFGKSAARSCVIAHRDVAFVFDGIGQYADERGFGCLGAELAVI